MDEVDGEHEMNAAAEVTSVLSESGFTIMSQQKSWKLQLSNLMTLHCFQVMATNAQTLSSTEDYPSPIIIFLAGVTGRNPDLITVHQN